MALIKCPECHSDVSDQTLRCPHCGYQINGLSYADKNRIKKIILWIVGVVLAIVAIVIIYDLCTVSTEELREDLRKSKQELEDIQDEIDDLERQKAINEWLIDYYEDKE